MRLMKPSSTGLGARIGKGLGASQLNKVPGMRKIPATAAGVLGKTIHASLKSAEDGEPVRRGVGGLVSGAGTGAMIGGTLAGALAVDRMTSQPGIISRLWAPKPTWNVALRQVGAGALVGAALGGGIGAMRRKNTETTKVGNVLGCMLWGTRSSPYAGPRTNPFAAGAKQANVLGQTRFGERTSPFAGFRTNPFARSSPPTEMKTASSAEGSVDGMAEAFERLVAGSVTPYRGFDYVAQGILKTAFEKDAGIGEMIGRGAQAIGHATGAVAGAVGGVGMKAVKGFARGMPAGARAVGAGAEARGLGRAVKGGLSAGAGALGMKSAPKPMSAMPFAKGMSPKYRISAGPMVGKGPYAMKTKSITKLSHEKDAGINRTMRMVESVGRKVIRGKEVPQGLAAATGRSTFHTAKRMEGLAKGLAAKGDAFEAGLHGAGRGLPPFGMGRIAGNVHATAKGYAEPITGAAHRLAGVARRESSSNVAGRVESMAGAVRRNAPDTAAGRIGKKLNVRTPGFMEGITKRKPMTADEAGVMGARAAGEYNAMRGSAVQGQGRPMQKMRKRLWGN